MAITLYHQGITCDCRFKPSLLIIIVALLSNNYIPMTQNDEKTEQLDAQKCPKCQDMYAHANFDNMCSRCYKTQKNLLVPQKPKGADPLFQEEHVQPELKQQSKNLKRELPKNRPSEQLPKGKCAKCTKKTGIFGYACKYCSAEFCKVHRMPEDHSCETDFISLGRKQLKLENPVVSSKKIADI